MRFYLLLFLLLFILCASWAIAADKIILVAGNVPLAAHDVLMKALLEKFGYEVEAHSQNEAQPVKTSGAAAVVILETVGSGNILDAYEGIPIPLITTEAYILDEMHFAPDNHTNDLPGQTSIVIIDPEHPIAEGFKGEMKIAPSDVWIQATCDPQAEGQIIAEAPVSKCACIVAWEEGVKKMDGSKAPARRLLTFATRNSLPIMTDDGWKLLENSLLWGLGMLEQSVVPKDSIATTWGTLKQTKK